MRTPTRWVSHVPSLSLLARPLLLGGCDRSDSDAKPSSDGGMGAGAIQKVVEKRDGLTIKKQVCRLPDGVTVDHGLCVMTYANGTKAGEGRFEDGRTTGIWRGWYSNGQLSMQGKHLFWQKESQWTWWNKDGSISKRESYARGLKLDKPPDGISTQPAALHPAS